MVVVSVDLGSGDYFKEANLFAEESTGKEVLEIILASGDRLRFQFETIDQNEGLINKLIDAQIARKREMGHFILKDL